MMENIYVAFCFLILGLMDFYLGGYPVFHPLVIIPLGGWLAGDLNHGLIAGAMLELIFGPAQFKKACRLNQVLYAGGLTVIINKYTNINFIFCLTFSLLIALIIQQILKPLKEWLKWIILAGFSLGIVFIIPLIQEGLGLIPAGFLDEINTAGEILPWIFFAYMIPWLFRDTHDKELLRAGPAIIVGSYLALDLNYWGPVTFIILYYFLDILIKNSNFLVSLNWILIAFSLYFGLPQKTWNTLGVFLSVLIFNIWLVIKSFSPLEVYLVVLVIGVLLSRSGLIK